MIHTMWLHVMHQLLSLAIAEAADVTRRNVWMTRIITDCMQVTPGLSDHSSQGIGWPESADTERHKEFCCGWICTEATLASSHAMLRSISTRICCCINSSRVNVRQKPKQLSNASCTRQCTDSHPL